MNAATTAWDLRILRPWIRSAAIFLFAATASTATAQFALANGPGSSWGIHPFVGVGDYGYDGDYPSFHASTAGESFARGRADVIRSQGEFNRLSSEAAINAQAAREHSIKNAQDAVQAYFNIQRMGRDYRQSERSPRPSAEAIQRYARAARPEALSPSELDVLTGRINWPILLRDETFQATRTRLEELFDRWAVSRNLGASGNFGARDYLTVLELTKDMTGQLRGQIRDLPSQDYVSAKRFLEGLAFAVKSSNQPETSLAANVSETTP